MYYVSISAFFFHRGARLLNFMGKRDTVISTSVNTVKLDET